MLHYALPSVPRGALEHTRELPCEFFCPPSLVPNHVWRHGCPPWAQPQLRERRPYERGLLWLCRMRRGTCPRANSLSKLPCDLNELASLDHQCLEVAKCVRELRLGVLCARRDGVDDPTCLRQDQRMRWKEEGRCSPIPIRRMDPTDSTPLLLSCAAPVGTTPVPAPARPICRPCTNVQSHCLWTESRSTHLPRTGLECTLEDPVEGPVAAVAKAELDQMPHGVPQCVRVRICI